jgi:hypothetical protein
MSLLFTTDTATGVSRVLDPPQPKRSAHTLAAPRVRSLIFKVLAFLMRLAGLVYTELGPRD